MKAFKGFNKDMTCLNFKFEEGKEYEEKGKIQACNNGFHACEYPLDCFSYYPPASSVYHEVEQSGELSRDGDDTKVASKKIKIGIQLGIPGLVKAAIEYTKSHTTTEHTDPNIATAGNYGAATSRGISIVGENGIACARGNGVRVKGGLGAVLVLVEEEEFSYDIKAWKAIRIDGKRYKADVFYALKDGKVMRAD